MLNRRTVLAGLPLLVLAGRAAAQAAPAIHVVLSPTCGCCRDWLAHLRQAGFRVTFSHATEATEAARQRGVPADLRSCHTGAVGGYVIEGHVPAADIRRLLRERPAAAGLAVPGMPMGSPGMEQGGRREPYQTILFTRTGRRTVFAQH